MLTSIQVHNSTIENYKLFYIMRTRKQCQQKSEQIVKKHASLKFKINKFINPFSIFRISHSLYIEEQYFNNQTINYLPHGTFFQMNKIVRGKVQGDFIKLTVIPVVNECQMDNNYIIQRFESFGDQKFKALADAIIKVRDLKKRVPEIKNDFCNLDQVITKFDSKSMMFIISDNINQQSSNLNGHQEIYVSKSLMNKNGFYNPQQYIMECIQKGNIRLPFRMNFDNSSRYLDRIVANIQSMISSIQGALEIKQCRQSKKQSHSISHHTNDIFDIKALEVSQIYQSHNSRMKYQFMQTPFFYCSRVVSESTQQIPPLQLQNRMNGLVDDQEYDILQKLIPVAQNKLKRFQDKICLFRQISKCV